MPAIDRSAVRARMSVVPSFCSLAFHFFHFTFLGKVGSAMASVAEYDTASLVRVPKDCQCSHAGCENLPTHIAGNSVPGRNPFPIEFICAKCLMKEMRSAHHRPDFIIELPEAYQG